jgi:hypothetical protein
VFATLTFQAPILQGCHPNLSIWDKPRDFAPPMALQLLYRLSGLVLPGLSFYHCRFKKLSSFIKVLAALEQCLYLLKENKIIKRNSHRLFLPNKEKNISKTRGKAYTHKAYIQSCAL